MTTPTPIPTITTTEEIISKLKLAVEGENAAVWAFGYLLSFIPDSNKGYAFSVFNLHRDNRDKLRLRLRELGIVPPRPQELYELPFEVSDLVTAYKLASFIENRLIGIYLQLFSLEDKSIRKISLQFALDGALRMLDFKQTPKALPGSLN